MSDNENPEYSYDIISPPKVLAHTDTETPLVLNPPHRERDEMECIANVDGVVPDLWSIPTR